MAVVKTTLQTTGPRSRPRARTALGESWSTEERNSKTIATSCKVDFSLFLSQITILCLISGLALANYYRINEKFVLLD